MGAAQFHTLKYAVDICTSMPKKSLGTTPDTAVCRYSRKQVFLLSRSLLLSHYCPCSLFISPENIQKLMVFYSDYFTEVYNKGTWAVMGKKRLLPAKLSSFVKILKHIVYRTPPDDC